MMLYFSVTLEIDPKVPGVGSLLTAMMIRIRDCATCLYI